MEVELHRDLLTARPREDLTLLALCTFALSGRHRILPDDRALWNSWAADLPPECEDEVRFAWDESERRAADGGPSERAAVLPAGPPRFDRAPIELTPSEAFVLLGRPLRVLLENGRNDRAFVLAFADEATHRALLDAEREGWVVFETAGGIGELLKRINEAPTNAPREVFRTMYLCDSDARQARLPSNESRAVVQRLTNLSAQYARPFGHFGAVLSRRAAENYAPPSEVLSWACSALGSKHASGVIAQAETPAGRARLAGEPGAPASPKRRLLAAIALRELPPALRGFLDMKEGRLRRNPAPKPDAPRTADAVWSQLDDFQKAVLYDGFGASFSADFYTGRSGLKDETQELTALLATIRERL